MDTFLLKIVKIQTRVKSWKLRFFFYNDTLKLTVRFFFRHFIELETLRLDDKMLGFFEVNPNIQHSMKQ